MRSLHICLDCYSVFFFSQEKDLNLIRESKIQQEILDQEDSLRRARLDASCADGISWGMGEDAIEEAEVCVALKF